MGTSSTIPADTAATQVVMGISGITPSSTSFQQA